MREVKYQVRQIKGVFNNEWTKKFDTQMGAIKKAEQIINEYPDSQVIIVRTITQMDVIAKYPK